VSLLCHSKIAPDTNTFKFLNKEFGLKTTALCQSVLASVSRCHPIEHYFNRKVDTALIENIFCKMIPSETKPQDTLMRGQSFFDVEKDNMRLGYHLVEYSDEFPKGKFLIKEKCDILCEDSSFTKKWLQYMEDEKADDSAFELIVKKVNSSQIRCKSQTPIPRCKTQKKKIMLSPTVFSPKVNHTAIVGQDKPEKRELSGDIMKREITKIVKIKTEKIKSTQENSVYSGSRKALRLNVCNYSGVSSRTRSHNKVTEETIGVKNIIKTTSLHPEIEALKLSCTHIENIDLAYLTSAAISNYLENQHCKPDKKFFLAKKKDIKLLKCDTYGYCSQLEIPGFKYGCFPGYKPLLIPMGLIRCNMDIPIYYSKEAARLALMIGVCLDVKQSPFISKCKELLSKHDIICLRHCHAQVWDDIWGILYKHQGKVFLSNTVSGGNRLSLPCLLDNKE